MHLLITRPEPDAAEIKDKLEALGHTVSLEPLLRIEPLPVASDAVAGAEAIIATSRNGLRALAASEAFAPALELPVLAVGLATAKLASELGFRRVIEGPGTASDLVPFVFAACTRGPVVHIAGESLAFDLAPGLAPYGIDVRTVTAYRALPLSELSPATRRLIAGGALDAVLLMSPRTAAIFAQLVGEAGLEAPARRLTYVCLSQAVAAALHNLAPPRIEIAVRPNSAAIIDAVGRVATGSSGV